MGASSGAKAPRSTGDPRVDAAHAAMAECLARRDGWVVPSWARLSGREAWPWWFVTGPARPAPARAGGVAVLGPPSRCLHHQRGTRPHMRAGLGREETRALLGPRRAS